MIDISCGVGGHDLFLASEEEHARKKYNEFDSKPRHVCMLNMNLEPADNYLSIKTRSWGSSVPLCKSYKKLPTSNPKTA